MLGCELRFVHHLTDPRRRQGQPGAGDRGDAVGSHVVALQLGGVDDRHRRDAGLGSDVIGLPDVAVQPGARRRVDDRPVDLGARLGLLPPVLGCVAREVERALEVHGDDAVEVLLGHRHEHPVAQDAGVVDDDVEVAERLDGLVRPSPGTVEGGDAVGVGHRLATGGDDLVDDRLGGRGVGTAAVAGAAEVVDDDLGALGSEQQGVLAADAAPAAGDDRNSSVQDNHQETAFVYRVTTAAPPRPTLCCSAALTSGT